jgi:hypothetical protein
MRSVTLSELVRGALNGDQVKIPFREYDRLSLCVDIRSERVHTHNTAGERTATP